MIKIAALNDESAEESDSEEEITKEALEQLALQQYAKALELQRKGNLVEATQLLKDLLDTELLYEVQKPGPGEKASTPLFNLKYLCYKNLAAMLSEANENDAAIDAYCAASELDDGDVMLWYKLGVLCFSVKRYEMALHAFQRGADRNPKHWPCLDKIITLLLGLGFKEECITAIYEALELDPGYLRGLVYRKHIYTAYCYIREFMVYLNPIYKWNENEDEEIDEVNGEKFLKEAEEIHETFVEQQKAEQFKYVSYEMKLKKPINQLTWEAVGDSLVNMHHYMSEHSYSHAAKIEILFEKEEIEEAMEVCEEPKEIDVQDSKPEESTDNETQKNPENGSENENNDLSDKDKGATDNEKVESDIEMVTTEAPAENQPDQSIEETKQNTSKTQKKAPVRRRGSALSFLQQWEWCTKRRSGRKKAPNKQDRSDDNIYDTLRRMVPICLAPEMMEKKGHQTRQSSPDIADLDKLFDEKEKSDKKDEQYFGTESEQKDVKQFINEYTENKRDIIDLLKDYLLILSAKWRLKWKPGLSNVYVEANKCYNSHIDVPTCTDENKEELLHYCAVNLLVEEFEVNEKMDSTTEEKQVHDLSAIETISITLSLRPQFFDAVDFLETMLRHLWVKLHIYLSNRSEELALDCLYQLAFEFESMGEDCKAYSIDVVNFTFKPVIKDDEVAAYIKFLERNNKLATVMELYDRENYEEVLSIVIDSFEHCKNLDKHQEEEMTLDFSAQLSLILDTYWALDKIDECFQWSLTCLHEALKHYFRYTSGSSDYEKWSVTVVKILCCMEHILTAEGLSCLDSVSSKQLSQGLEDLIRIIGHQVETNATEMPFGTVTPWIIMHYILQRQEDQGRGRSCQDADDSANEDIPNAIMLLFIGHDQLGNRGWCNKNEGKLLYFILDTVVPRLRSPSLAKALEQICQYMEQCVYCLYGHPGKKNKLKYLTDHGVTPHSLDWKRAQQIYEIFRPPSLPALEGKISGITADTEQLFHRILALVPPENDPQKHVSEMKKYINGIESKLPMFPQLLPYKMKDIYFLLGDYYFKKEDSGLAVKFNTLDLVINNDRLESWAEISLAKAVNLERLLNSCKNLNNEKEYLIPAKSVIRCFKRCLDLDRTHCNMWIEYGIFVYTVHSFCSRLLKQASESLSMEDFESLEKQKEAMLDTTQKCFTVVLEDLNSSNETEKNEDSWLQFYMLGKVAEKRNKPPSVYLNYYMQGVKCLEETDAVYPLKINYNSPSNMCIEVLELHYRIHASILKYIEQHENKPIPASVGQVFSTCIEEWKVGPFSKKPKRDNAVTTESQGKTEESTDQASNVQAANILKRSVSDAGEEDTAEAKRLKLESAAAKVRRSASYDTEIKPKESSTSPRTTEGSKQADNLEIITEEKTKPPPEPETVNTNTEEKLQEKPLLKPNTEEADKAVPTPAVEPGNKEESSSSSSSTSSSSSETSSDSSESSRDSDTTSKSSNEAKSLTDDEIMKIVGDCLDALEDCASRFPPHYKAIYRLAHYHFYYKKGKDIERCRDLMLSNFTSRAGQKLAGLFNERKHSNFFNNIWKIPHTEVDRSGGFPFHMNRSVLLTMEILKEIDDHKTLLELSLHLQRTPELDKKYLRDSDREELAQQAFSLCVQSLKGQLLKFGQQADLKSNEIERQALKSLMLDIYRAYQKAQKQPNSKQFTNLLVEGYKLVCKGPLNENLNLVDLSMKYCQSLIQALKQQATQASLDKSQHAQKKHSAKSAEVAKASIAGATVPKIDYKPPIVTTAASIPVSTSVSTTSLPKLSAQDMAASFQSYLPLLNDPMLSSQAAAALSLSSYLSNLSNLSNLSALSGFPPLQNTLQSSLQTSLQNSFQAEFYRQFLGQNFPYAPPPAKKQKRGPKPGMSRSNSLNSNSGRPSQLTANVSRQNSVNVTASRPNPVVSVSRTTSNPTNAASNRLNTGVNVGRAPNVVTSQLKSKSFHVPLTSSKPTPSTMISSLQKSTSVPLAPSMGTVLPTLPPSMSANLTSFGASGLSTHTSIHKSQSHQIASGKTLQEKLAEKQKNMPLPKPSTQDLSASISRLPSSLTVTKTSVSKSGTKKMDKKETDQIRAKVVKPISSDEIIVLDDD